MIRLYAAKALRTWYVVAGLLWFARYATLAHIAPWQRPIWIDWFDQSRYLASATAFAHADLAAGQHWYPLSYSLVAAPFAWLLPSDPFFLLDLSLFLLTCRAFQRVLARLGIARWPATWCFLATTLIQTGLASAWAQPWTTTLSAALIWWLLDRIIVLCERQGEQDLRSLAITGALAAAVPLTRPVDALLSLTCLAVAGIVLVRRRRMSAAVVLAIGFGGLAVCACYAALHLAIYGPHATPYMIAAAQTGFVLDDLGWKAYTLLIDPSPWYGDGKSILQTLPWIIPGCAGLLAQLVVGSTRQRLIVAFLLITLLPVSALMLTYADLQPPGLWRFGNIHYFKATIPLFGCGVLLGWRMLHRRAGRRAFMPALILLLLPLGIRVTPVAVDRLTPARMLSFKGDSRRDWQEAYFASVVMTDDKGLLHNVGGFHQIPAADGERAIAIVRLFGRNPRRADPGEPRLRTDQRPYARFGEKVSFLGLP